MEQISEKKDQPIIAARERGENHTANLSAGTFASAFTPKKLAEMISKSFVRSCSI